MSETSDLLSGLNAGVLNALARKLGAPCASTRKPDVIAALDGLIHGNVQRILDRLSETERRLLAEAAFGDGCVYAQRFAAKYEVACPLPSAQVYPTSQASPLLLLIADRYGPLRLPASVAKVLRSVLCEPAAATVKVTDSLPTLLSPPQDWRKAASRPIHIHEGERMVFPELRQILKLVQAGKLKVADKSRRPTEVTVRLIGEILLAPDFLLEPPADQVTKYTERAGAVRAHAWGVLVQQCGWAKVRGGKLSLTASGQKLIGSLDVAEFARGVGEFLSDDEFDELNRINHYMRAFLFESLATLGLIDVAYTYPHSLWPELGDS